MIIVLRAVIANQFSSTYTHTTLDDPLCQSLARPRNTLPV